jgi:hypothetical protein
VHNISNKKTYYILAILIVISIVVRIPNLSKPLSKHHEFNAAMILNVCNSWELGGGPSKFNYTPVTHYGKPGDNYVGNHSMVANGKFYYASLGPMQFLAPYYFFKLLNLPHTPISLQLFAMVIHIVLLVLFCWFIHLKFQNQKEKNFLILIGASLLLLLPNFLWFFSNSFSHESLALLFYFIVLIATQLNQSWVKMLLLSIAVFSGILTDWFIVVVAAIYALHLIVLWVKHKSTHNLYNVFWITISGVAALFFIFHFYSTELGQDKFINLLKEKWLSRSNNFDASFWKTNNVFVVFIINLFSSYLAIFIFCLLFFKKYFLKNGSLIKNITWLLLIVAPLIYNIALLEFSIRHDYANLKYGFALILLACYFVAKNEAISNYKKIAWIALVAITNIAIYYTVNNINYSNKNYKQFGDYINKNANDSASIFINNQLDNYPIIMYYAKRNFQYLENEKTFNDTIKKYNIKNAQFFKTIQRKDRFSVEIITPKNE